MWGWPVFPEKYRRFDNSAVQKFIEDHQDAVHIYMYLQWIADTQIHEVQSLAEEKGMAVGLYRDLAVGVADSGSETWADHGHLLQDVSIGAPPDVLGPLGQNWGLPPLNPQALQATAYDAYIKLLRANMKELLRSRPCTGFAAFMVDPERRKRDERRVHLLPSQRYVSDFGA